MVQHSKKRNYEELLDKFQSQIREAMPHLKDTKIAEKVHRCLNIWSERQVFEDRFVQELISMIDPSQNRAEQDILDNFQVSEINKTGTCSFGVRPPNKHNISANNHPCGF